MDLRTQVECLVDHYGSEALVSAAISSAGPKRVSQSTINRLRAGSVDPRLSTILAIQRLYDSIQESSDAPRSIT